MWAGAKLVPAAPPRADAQTCPLNRIGKVIPAVTCTPLGAGRFELDFGTNLAGQMRLRMPSLKANQRVSMTYADRKYGKDEMTRNGPADMQVAGLTENVRYQTFKQTDEFISAGRAQEEFR